MFSFILSAVLTGVLGLAADERVFIVPQDSNPFNVTMDEMVRIPAHGIAGSIITYDVKGPAKLIRVNNIMERAGGHSIIGISKKEAEIKPTGTGLVKVTVSVKPPNRNEGKVVTFEFEIK